MKKVFASLLILAIVMPTFALAAVNPSSVPINTGAPNQPPPIDSSLAGNRGPNPETGAAYSGGTNAAEQVGCDSGGGLGGSLAQAVGGMLQGIVGQGASKLRQAISGIGGSGPLGQAFSQISNTLLGAGTRYLQNQIAGLTNDALSAITGGGVSEALTGVTVTGLTPGAQEFLNQVGLGDAISAGVGVGAGMGMVPVIDNTAIAEQKKILAENKKIYKEADRIKQAQETLVTKECIADPLVQRIKQQLIAMIVKSMMDWINNGFEGGPAFVQNLRQFLRGATEAVLYDFVSNQLSGICAPFQNDIKVALISQYQYQDSFQKRIQCTGEADGSGSGSQDNGPNANLAEGGVGNGFSMKKFWSNTFSPQNTPQGAFREADAEQRLQERSKAAEELEKLRYGNGFKSGETCEDQGDVPEGHVCINGKVNLPGAIIRDQASSKVDAGFQQLLSADEISEIIDSLMAGLLDVAFQGIDGLLGLSKSSSSSNGGANRGTYLDQLVSGPSGQTTGTAQGVIIGDVNGVATVEATYNSLLNALLAVLRQTRTAYTQVKQCYTSLASTKPTYQAFALGQAQYASTTVSTILDPLLRQTEADILESEHALDALDTLFAQAEAATTPAAINAAAAAYAAYVQSGAVHTNTELSALQNDINANAPILDGLYNDALIKLTECRALTNPAAYLCAQPGAANPCALPNPLIPITVPLPGQQTL